MKVLAFSPAGIPLFVSFSSYTHLLEFCESPSSVLPPAPPSPTLPWKSGGGVGSLPPCVSVETKIIPVDLQQAWNQSISSLESISSPGPAPPAALQAATEQRVVNPRALSALGRLVGQRPASYTPGSTITIGRGTAMAMVSMGLRPKPGATPGGPQIAQGAAAFLLSGRKEEEEEEEEVGL